MHTKVIPMEDLAEVIALQLQNGGQANLTVTGSSMLPMLRHRRDSVTLTNPGSEKVGDVILYRRENGQYILHRLIGLQENHYLCCGDNQARPEQVSPEQVLGVVTGFVRKGKPFRVQATAYRLYQTIWVRLFFLRPGYIWLRRQIGRFINKRFSGRKRV